MKTSNWKMENIKINKEEALALLAALQKEAKRQKKNRQDVPLSLKANNIVKLISPQFSYDKRGEWNGYGYERLGKHVKASDISALIPQLRRLINATAAKKEVKKLSEEEKNKKWAEKLARLTGITVPEAEAIAEAKKEYKARQIEALEERQLCSFSPKRMTLINRIMRSNPLRPIKDIGHAEAILEAHHRHADTNYEQRLEEGRSLAACGEIAREEVREYARNNAY